MDAGRAAVVHSISLGLAGERAAATQYTTQSLTALLPKLQTYFRVLLGATWIYLLILSVYRRPLTQISFGARGLFAAELGSSAAAHRALRPAPAAPPVSSPVDAEDDDQSSHGVQGLEQTNDHDPTFPVPAPEPLWTDGDPR